MLHAMRICGVFKPRTVTDDESIDTRCIGIVSMGQGLGTPLNNMSLHLNSMGVSQARSPRKHPGVVDIQPQGISAIA